MANRTKFPDLWMNRYVNAGNSALQVAGTSVNYYNPQDMALDLAWWANNSVKWTVGNPSDESGWQSLMSWHEGVDLFNRPKEIWKYDYSYGSFNAPLRREWIETVNPDGPNFLDQFARGTPGGYEQLAFMYQSQVKPLGTMPVFAFNTNRDISTADIPGNAGGLPGTNRHEANRNRSQVGNELIWR